MRNAMTVTAEVRVIGPASCTPAIGNAELINGNFYLTSRGTDPLLVAEYDPDLGRITRSWELPTGAGAWGIASVDDLLYVGTHWPADIYELDPHRGSVRRLGSALPDDFIWALGPTPDSQLIVGTSPGGRILELDLRSGNLRDFGPAVPGETYVKSVAADRHSIYAGVGQHAHLVRIDRRTGERQQLLGDDGTFRNVVYSIGLNDGYVVGGIAPYAEVAVAPLRDGAQPVERLIRLTGAEDTFVSAISLAQTKAIVAALPSGLWYEVDVESGDTACLGAPRPGAFVMRFIDCAARVYGILSEGSIASYERRSGRFSVTDLADCGFPSRPESPMSLAVDEHHVYVGGKNGIQVHDIAKASSQRVYVPGEPKVISASTNPIILGLYDPAQVGVLDVANGSARVVGPVGNEQARPQGIAADPAGDIVVITTQPLTGVKVGALSIVRPSTGAIEVIRGLLSDQSLYGVALRDGVAYIGGDVHPGLGLLERAVGPAELAAYDLTARAIRWRTCPVSDAEKIVGLCVISGWVVGMTDHGWAFAVRLDTGEECRTIRVGQRGGDVVTDGTDAYCTTGDMVVRVDLNSDELRATTIAEGLTADWYADPKLVISAAGMLYTVRGRDLVSIMPVEYAAR
jgi:hypothetical protein